jgi:hypothetical protein
MSSYRIGDDDPRAMAADDRWTRADMPLRARFCRDQVDAGTSCVRDAGFMSSSTDVSWDEIDRGEAALVVRATRWSLPLNPADCEAIAASVIGASRSNASRDEIYALTEAAIASHEQAIEGLYRRGTSSQHDSDSRSD